MFYRASMLMENLLQLLNLIALFIYNPMTLGEGNDIPLQYSCLENPMDGGAWKAAVQGVAEGWTPLASAKQLKDIVVYIP